MLLFVSQETGIPLSATFNNIQVPPTQENLDIFINFRFLYDNGVRIVTPTTYNMDVDWADTERVSRIKSKEYYT